MITDENPYVSESFDWKAHDAKVKKLESEGYVIAPDWMPVPHEAYEWECVDGIEAMMRPAPTIQHQLEFQNTRRISREDVKGWF